MKNWFLKILNSLFSRARVMIGITLSMIFASAFIYAFQLLNLNVFSPNTTISSTEVNDNFSQLNEALSQVPVGFSVGLTTDFSMNSGSTVTFSVDKINYDFTENQLATTLTASDYFSVPQTGFYQILVYPKSQLGNGELNFLEGGTTTLASVYMNTSSSFIGAGSHYFLNSGDQITIKATTYDATFIIDAETFKIKFIQF